MLEIGSGRRVAKQRTVPTNVARRRIPSLTIVVEATLERCRCLIRVFVNRGDNLRRRSETIVVKCEIRCWKLSGCPCICLAGPGLALASGETIDLGRW